MLEQPAKGGIPPVEPAPGWGAALGHLDFGIQEPSVFAEPLAVHLITERVHRYGWAFDERQTELLADCFTPGALWSGSIGGVETIEPLRGRDEIVRWLSAFWDRQDDQRRHHMMSVSVALSDPDHAVAFASLLLTSARQGNFGVVLTSFYRFEVERADEVWRIRSLFEGCDVSF